MTPKEKAKQIAEVLFTDGNGEKANRLVLTDAAGQDMGGWSERAVIDWLEKLLANSQQQQRGEGAGSENNK